MSNVPAAYVSPAINKRSFNCPHCRTLAQQYWFKLWANDLPDSDTPSVVPDTVDIKSKSYKNFLTEQPAEDREEMDRYFRGMLRKKPFLGKSSYKHAFDLHCVYFSRCFHCKDFAIWIHDRLVWPQQVTTPLPNPDLPTEIQTDYQEASTILALSPRGAAALLRLCIQKLCKHLGEKGKDLNGDIARLVKKGLPEEVQMALDSIRVIGGESVHPGQLDLRDDSATASRLFELVNIIAEIMISQRKRVSEIYNKLPKSKLEAIEKRDAQ